MRTYTPLYSEKWEKLFAEESARGRQDYLDSLAAEEAMKSLERRFEAMGALLTSQATETEGVKALIRGAQQDIAAQKRANSTLTRRISTMYRTPRTSDLADKVFGMPELLEHILTYTSVPDLLRLYRVGKVFYNTIEGSTLLQRRLGLQASPSCHLDLPAEHLVSHVEGMDMNEIFYCGRMFDDNVEPEPNVMPIKISVCTYSCRHKPGEQIQLRPLGARCKKMLITQPPIKEMRVYMQCCTPTYRPYRDRQTDPPMEILTCETGITTELVWELVARVQKEHRLCPHADSYDHDSEGFVQVRMTIEGSVVLKDDDPALVAKEKRRKESREEDEEFQSREVRFRPYIAAKRAGE